MKTKTPKNENLRRSFSLRSEQGFSLVGALVAAAITGIIAMVLAELFATNMKLVSGIAKSYEGEALHNEIRSLLGDHRSCRASLSGQADNASITQLLRVPDAGAPVVEYQTGQTYGGKDEVRLESMRLVNRSNVYAIPGGGQSAQITLRIGYSKTGQNIGAQQFSRTVNLFAKFSASNVIVECIAKALMTDGIWRVTPASGFTPSWDVFYSEGRVGIGTDQPQARLHMVKTTGAPEEAFKFEQPGSPGIQTFSLMRTGNMFIGTQEFGDTPLPTSFETSAAPSMVINGGTLTVRASQTAAASMPMMLLQAEPAPGMGGGAVYRFGRGGVFRLAASPAFYDWARPTGSTPFTLPSGMYAITADEYPVTAGGMQIGGGSIAVWGSPDAGVIAPLLQMAAPISSGGALYRFGRQGHVLMESVNTRLDVKQQNNPTRTIIVPSQVTTPQIVVTTATFDQMTTPPVAGAGPGWILSPNIRTSNFQVTGGPGTTNLGGPTTIGGPLQVNNTINSTGNITTQGQVFAASDRRFKTDITPVTSALDEILKLQGVRFKWRESNRTDMGVIAQDVEKVFPELVAKQTKPSEKKGEADTDFLTVSYNGLIAAVIEALRDLKNWLLNHDQKIAELEAKNDALAKQVQLLNERLMKLEEDRRKPASENP